MKKFIKEVRKVKNKLDWTSFKPLIKKHKLKQIPSYTQLFLASKGKIKIQTKPSRTISGVAPVAVMTKPIKCPHGRCTICPTIKNIPQSYTGKEPASRRGLRNKFHPYLQVMNRLEQYTLLGNNPNKVELIIMGGNFTSFPVKYQNWFIKNCIQAMNDFSKFNFKQFTEIFELDPENKYDDPQREKRIQNNLLKLNKNKSFNKIKLENEKVKVKCIAIVIETRPDYCKQKQINLMLKQGVTRVELGVQSVYDNVLERINRKHTVQDSINATKLLKDASLKVGYHILLGAPGSSTKKDYEMFKILFSNPDFKPDALKIYPCMVFKNTKLHKEYKAGKFNPITTSLAIKLLNKIKPLIPEYCRIMRVQRDIPTYMSEAGVDKTNLRQYLKAKCRCIRCRQIKDKIKGKVTLKRINYEASGGKEIFLSYENKDKLIGFLRLRIINNQALVRELHIYGNITELGKKGKTQHRGFGKKLLKLAESIVKENNINKITVISGIGVRPYYYKLGYKLDQPYVKKSLI